MSDTFLSFGIYMDEVNLISIQKLLNLFLKHSVCNNTSNLNYYIKEN